MGTLKYLYEPKASPLLEDLRARDERRAKKVVEAYFKNLKIKKPCINRASNNQ